MATFYASMVQLVYLIIIYIQYIYIYIYIYIYDTMIYSTIWHNDIWYNASTGLEIKEKQFQSKLYYPR